MSDYGLGDEFEGALALLLAGDNEGEHTLDEDESAPALAEEGALPPEHRLAE